MFTTTVRALCCLENRHAVYRDCPATPRRGSTTSLAPRTKAISELAEVTVDVVHLEDLIVQGLGFRERHECGVDQACGQQPGDSRMRTLTPFAMNLLAVYLTVHVCERATGQPVARHR